MRPRNPWWLTESLTMKFLATCVVSLGHSSQRCPSFLQPLWTQVPPGSLDNKYFTVIPANCQPGTWWRYMVGVRPQCGSLTKAAHCNTRQHRDRATTFPCSARRSSDCECCSAVCCTGTSSQSYALGNSSRQEVPSSTS